MSSLTSRVVLGLLLPAALASAGCASIGEAIYPPGEVRANGKISPCQGFRTNGAACGMARYNVKRVEQIKVGQSIDEVTGILGYRPRMRTTVVREGNQVENWPLIVDYENSIYLHIQFLNGKVDTIKRGPA